MFLLSEEVFIYLSLLIVLVSMIFYAIDNLSIIFKSIVILTFLLIFFQYSPFESKMDQKTFLVLRQF